MGLIRYKIQEEDTLLAIAEKHNIDLSDMLQFHNENSELTQQIYSDYIPIHVVTILLDVKNAIPAVTTAAETGTKPTALIYAFPQNAQYKISISTSLFYMGKPVSENKIESIWQINYDEKDNTVLIQVLGKKYDKVDGHIKPLLEIVDKINKATDILHLQLTDVKTIKHVANRDSVLDRWEHIKFEDLKFHELEDDHFRLIIESFDKEFRNLSESLEKNILYKILFYPQDRIRVPALKPLKIAENSKTISQLFPQQEISYSLFATSTLEDDRIMVSCSAESAKGSNTDLLRAEFMENYAQLLKEPFDFSFSLDSKYEYNLEGYLQKSKSYIKEQASKELFYIGEYEITLLPQELNESNLKV